MNKNIILALAALLALLSYSQFSKEPKIDATIPKHVVQIFQEWLIKNEKSYESPEELVHRLNIFFKNYLFITETNKKHAGTLVLGLNQFADLHVDEFHLTNVIEESPMSSLISEDPKKQSNLTNFNPNDLPTSVDWENPGEGKPSYLPPVGKQVNSCLNQNFAWSLQYAIGANDMKTNSRSTPMVVSAQYFIDCFMKSGNKFSCGIITDGVYLESNIKNKDLPLVDEYKGKCQSPWSDSVKNVSQQVEQKPFVENVLDVSGSDSKLMKAVEQGVVLAKVYMKKTLVQFYQKGLMKDNMCNFDFHSSEMGYYTIAVTGYNVSKYEGETELPAWKIRWAYGSNWGIKGSMLVEKSNTQFGTVGPCKIHSDVILPVMRWH